jgi:type VI protein secretion system component Hcp
MTLTGARITAYDIQSDVGADGAPTLTEHIRLTYKKVRVDYVPQSATGAGMGAGSFEAETAIT